jgi:hypothetical protein
VQETDHLHMKSDKILMIIIWYGAILTKSNTGLLKIRYSIRFKMDKLGYTDYIEHSSLHDRYAWYNNIPRDSRSIGSCRKFVEFLSVGFGLSDPTGSLHLSTRILSDFIGFRQNPDRNLITGSLLLGLHINNTIWFLQSFI